MLERQRKIGGGTATDALGGEAAGAPGKRTLTEGLGAGGAPKLRPKDGDGDGAATDGAALAPSVGAEVRASPAPAPGVTPNGPTAPPPSGPAWVQGKHVAPTFTVREVEGARSTTAPSTTDTDAPTYTGHVALGDGQWHYQLDTVTSTGLITYVYYPLSSYPAPTPSDDHGPLTNVTEANWKDMVKDLKAHRTGKAKAWSAYRAEVLHERYHWEVEWQGEVRKAVRSFEADLEKITIHPTAAPTLADAETALRPKVDAAFAAAMKAARAAYDALGDSPGDPPYVAQAPAIDALVTRIEDHAKAKGWK